MVFCIYVLVKCQLSVHACIHIDCRVMLLSNKTASHPGNNYVIASDLCSHSTTVPLHIHVICVDIVQQYHFTYM